MTSGSKLNPARAVLAAALACLVLCLVLAPAAQAADPIFPIGSRVGLVPPAGMVVSKGFLGFEDVAKDSAILIAAQPPAAFPEIEKSSGDRRAEEERHHRGQSRGDDVRLR